MRWNDLSLLHVSDEAPTGHHSPVRIAAHFGIGRGRAAGWHRSLPERTAPSPRTQDPRSKCSGGEGITTKPTGEPPTVPSPRLDASGRYVNVAPRSIATIGFYLVLAGILFYLNGVSTFAVPSFPAILALVLFVYLARYLSTRYVMDSDTLTARRLFGSRRVRLDEIRRIELANLRDLGPIGLVGTWGWRGRVWSPVIGTFECIHTVSPGILVSVGAVPMFLSPRDPMAFARELSRRARSWGVELEPDAPSLSSRRSGA